MTAKHYRVAIVGTGGIAEQHAQALADSERARLVAIADVDPARSEAFASRWGSPARFSDLDALLAAGGVDLVHICTPPQSHATLVEQCLLAGVIPVVEKPPTLSLEQLDRLIDIEASSAVTAVCIFQQRFGSTAVRLRGLIEEGALGRVLVAQCSTLWFRDDDYFAVPWRGRWDIEGGGPTMGHGIHQMDLLLSLIGTWSTVRAVATRLSRPTETEDVSAALLTMASGAIVTVINSLLSPREVSSVRIDFERATVELDHLYGYDRSHWRVTPAPGHEDLALALDQDTDMPSGHLAQFHAIFDSLDRGERAPISLADARPVVELIAALYAAAFEDRSVAAGELDASSPFYSGMNGGRRPWSN